MAGHPVDVSLVVAIPRSAAYAAGVSTACRQSSHFSLLAQRKVTQRNGLSSWQHRVESKHERSQRVPPDLHGRPPQGYFHALRNAPDSRGLKAEPRFASPLRARHFSLSPPGRGPGQGALRQHRQVSLAIALGSGSWLLALGPWGPRMTRRVGGGSARRVARRVRASFSPGQDALSKNPATHPRTWRAARPARRVIRGALSFGYFSLGKQRKVTRAAAAARKPAAGEPGRLIATTKRKVTGFRPSRDDEPLAAARKSQPPRHPV